MISYTREFESTESKIIVISRGNEVRFIKSDYTEDFELVNKKCFIKIMNSEISTNKWCELIENTFNVTNCYDLNDWGVTQC